MYLYHKRITPYFPFLSHSKIETQALSNISTCIQTACADVEKGWAIPMSITDQSARHVLYSKQDLEPLIIEKMRRDDMSIETEKSKGYSHFHEAAELILKGLHEAFDVDVSDRNYKDTSKRVAKMYFELFDGCRDTEKQAKDILSAVFDDPAAADPQDDQMIIVRGIRTYSMCMHHLLPIQMKVDVGYLPNEKVLGLSKIPRLVHLLAHQPILQEKFTKDVADYLYKILGPQGCGVRVRGIHMCMAMRGVKTPDAEMVTSALRGVFRKDKHQRQFLGGE